MHEGDEIISVNEEPTSGRTPSQLKTVVVGRAGTRVNLGIRKRSGQVELVSRTRGYFLVIFSVCFCIFGDLQQNCCCELRIMLSSIFNTCAGS